MRGDTFGWDGKLQYNPLKEIVSNKQISGYKLNKNYALILSNGKYETVVITQTGINFNNDDLVELKFKDGKIEKHFAKDVTLRNISTTDHQILVNCSIADYNFNDENSEDFFVQTDVKLFEGDIKNIYKLDKKVSLLMSNGISSIATIKQLSTDIMGRYYVQFLFKSGKTERYFCKDMVPIIITKKIDGIDLLSDREVLQINMNKITSVDKKYSVKLPNGNFIVGQINMIGKDKNDKEFVDFLFNSGTKERFFIENLNLTEVNQGTYFWTVLPSRDQLLLDAQSVNILSSSDIHMLKDLALEYNEFGYKYTIPELYYLIKDNVKVEYSVVACLIQEYRNAIDKMKHTSKENSGETINIKNEKDIIGVDDNENLLNMDNVNAILKMPINTLVKADPILIRLLILYFSTKVEKESSLYLSFQDICFEQNTSNYLVSNNNVGNKIINFFWSKYQKENYENLSHIMKMISSVRYLLRSKYKSNIQYIENFIEIGKDRISNLKYFVTNEFYMKNEKQIFSNIASYNEYLLLSTGKPVNITLLDDLCMYFSLTGFVADVEDCDYLNSILKKVATPSEPEFLGKMEFLLYKGIIDNDTYNLLIKMPSSFKSKLNMMIKITGQLPKKLEQLHIVS